MKKNFFLSLCGFFIMTTLFSCNDDNTLGSSIQPDKDKISVVYDTVLVNSETVHVDSVFLRNSVAMLGEFTDPNFGTTKSDFMAQLYSARKFTLPNDVEHIDSAYMYMYFKKWFGDSATVHHVNIYELNKPLSSNTTYFSNTNPDNYYSKSDLIGEGAFTTGDFYTPDSVRELSTYSQVVRIPIKTDLANRFLAAYRSDSTQFSTPEKFRDYFKGIYITTDYGNGSILYITKTQMEFCFDTWQIGQSVAGARDTFFIGASYFPVNKEVKQINRTEHKDLSQYLNTSSSDSINYIYAPGGMFTKVTIPDTLFKKGSGKLSGKTISSLRLEVEATQLEDDDRDYKMDPPSALLLVNAAKASKFFQEYKLSDNMNAFLATYDSSEGNYVFDLSLYAQQMINSADGTGTVYNAFSPFTEMLIIPVTVVTNDDSDNVRIDHMITPAAVKIKSSKHPYSPMKLQVLYTKTK